MKVLIIDDENKARSLLQTIISECCSEIEAVYEASNLLDGVAILKSKAIDVLFLDIEMPQHSGLEPFDFINVNNVNFEIILTTAYSE